jgi:DNA-binding response OmpR family regulator
MQIIKKGAEGSAMEKTMKILVADDNEEIREFIRVLLEGEGYEIAEAADGEEACQKTDDSIDLIILDVMMPVKNGYKACMEIREKTTAPILVLTAKTQDSDKALGFSLGGDDYLSKPFSYAELVSRIKALLRRYYVYQGKEPKSESKTIQIGDMQICMKANQVFVGEAEIHLTDIEYRLLLLLAQNRGKIFSAQNLYESVWNEPYLFSSSNTVMAHIKNIRRKLGDDTQNPKIIKTVWGRGYRIE